MFLAADKLRKNPEPSDYKHVALGLIFLKHISNAFAEARRRTEGAARLPALGLIKDPKRAGLDDDLRVYEIVEEASRQWLQRRGKWPPRNDTLVRRRPRGGDF